MLCVKGFCNDHKWAVRARESITKSHYKLKARLNKIPQEQMNGRDQY